MDFKRLIDYITAIHIHTTQIEYEAFLKQLSATTTKYEAKLVIFAWFNRLVGCNI